jgi:TonB family protein
MRGWCLVCSWIVLLVSSTAAAEAIDLTGLRIAGATWIEPDDETMTALETSGEIGFTTTLDVCLEASGTLRTVRLATGSGHAGYDDRVLATVKRTWRFRPYRKQRKKARAVCGQVMVSYQTGELVSPSVLGSLRVSGDKNILPDVDTRAAIATEGKTRVVVPVKVCLTDTGAIRSVRLLESSGFPAYDQAVSAAIKRWTYQPYLVDGAARAACGAVTLVYVQKT